MSSKGEPHFTFQRGSQEKLLVLNTDGSAKTIITGSGLSGFSPVILDNGAIITAKYLSGNQFFTAYSSAGAQLWDVSYSGANGNVPSSPSYNQTTGKTYSVAGPKLFEITSSGSVINTHHIADQGVASTLVAMSANNLYVGFDYSAVNPASGSKLFSIKNSDLTTNWSFSTDSKINQQLVVDNSKNIYFSTKNGKLYSISSTGSQRWVINSGSNSDISPIISPEGLIWGFGNKVVLIDD